MLGGKSFFAVTILALTSMSFSLNATDGDHTGQDFAPSASPDGNFIAYYAYRGEPSDLSDLFIVEVDTGIERRVTHTPGIFEIEPRWSPDGSEIVFAAGPSMKELALYTIKPDGSDYRLMYEGDAAGTPAWSPNGSKMALWHPYDDGTSELFIQNFDSGAGTILDTGLGGVNTGPDWSPDGMKLVFSHRDLNEDGNQNETAAGADGLYILDLETGHLTRLLNRPMAAYAATWTPSGTIYFMAAGTDGASHVYRVEEMGGDPIQVSPSENSPAYFPSLSHDGRHILFSGRVSGGNTRTLVMPIEGGKVREVTKVFAN